MGKIIMEVVGWSITGLLFGLFIYSLISPKFWVKDVPVLNNTEEEKPVVLEEEKPAPKKKRPYRKRKPKNDKGEK